MVDETVSFMVMIVGDKGVAPKEHQCYIEEGHCLSTFVPDSNSSNSQARHHLSYSLETRRIWPHIILGTVES